MFTETGFYCVGQVTSVLQDMDVTKVVNLKDPSPSPRDYKLSLNTSHYFVFVLVSGGTWTYGVSWRQNITFNRGACVDYCQFGIFNNKLLK